MICMSLFEIQHHLKQLQAERAEAWFAGLAGDSAYMADLDDEITTTSVAYVGAVVTEIARLRADLSGPQIG
jgi:hypothetical protein